MEEQGQHWTAADSAATSPLFVPLRLVFEEGGMVMQFDRPNMMVGRHSTADVRLPLADVSRQHCRFVYENGEWQVQDLDSLNGVFVNGERVHHSCVHEHDVVAIGSFRFVAEIGKDVNGSRAKHVHSSATQSFLLSIIDALPAEEPERLAS